MSKYIRGIKRNQIIERWKQGIEDPEYEVFPTKKEGKYIVRLRDSPADCEVSDPVGSSQKGVMEEVSKSLGIESEGSTEKEFDSNICSVNLSEKRKPISHSKVVRYPGVTSTDQTINLEILEQLRSLGEEMRNDRLLKEQKNYIKHVVNKELNKSRIRSKYVPDILVSQPSLEEPKEPETSELSSNSHRDREVSKESAESTLPNFVRSPKEPEYSEERNSQNKVLAENTFRSRIRR